MSARIIRPATENPSVNRCLDDKAMDHIDHALGRPIWPMKESYRNGFAIDIKSDLAASFEASPHWELGGVEASGMAYFHVTDAGRQALHDYLAGLDVDKRHRAYVVTFGGHSSIVPAKSRSHARYRKWLDISDVCELPFADFMKHSTVRAA